MAKKSEGDMQEQAALDSIMAMRGKKKAPAKKAPKPEKYDPTEGDMQEDAALQSAKSARGMACGGKVKKMKSGGMCRGGRAATRGTKFIGVR